MTSVLILAGSRGEACALCTEAGVASKALIPLGGARMIDHVLRALRDTPGLEGDIWVSGLDTGFITDGLPEDLIPYGARLHNAPAANGPAEAIVEAMKKGANLPLLVTTCDHPLLAPDMISNFLGQAADKACDFAVGLAERDVIQAAYPHVKRTYIKLGGNGYSGCNLFLISGEAGQKAAQFWRGAERHRKKPWKIAHQFGYGTLLRIVIGKLDIETAFAHGSAKIGAKISPVIIPFAEAAIDVDKPSDLALVRQIIAKAA